MATDPFADRLPVIVIADHQEWSARALMSVMSSAGYQVILADTAAQALNAAETHPPDLLFVNNALPNSGGIALCREFRQHPRFGVGLPILMTSSSPPLRTQRLTALRAGAWDVVSFPIDAEVLLLQVDSLLQARMESNRTKGGGLVDDLTGLYNLRGLETRAREITSTASRAKQAVACVALAPALQIGQQRFARRGTAPATPITASRLGDVLRKVGRASDAIGRLGELEFVIVAPATDRDGAVRLAERIASAVREAFADEDPTGFDIRAGFDTVYDAGYSAITPHDLLGRAAKALEESRRSSGSTWIQPFQDA